MADVRVTVMLLRQIRGSVIGVGRYVLTLPWDVPALLTRTLPSRTAGPGMKLRETIAELNTFYGLPLVLQRLLFVTIPDLPLYPSERSTLIFPIIRYRILRSKTPQDPVFLIISN